jgi:hypothetical protein
MTVAQMAELIGKGGLFSVNGEFKVAVVVQDVRVTFGRTDYLIWPTDGTGYMWVSAGRVTVI